MRIDCALLCDAVTVREGLLHILGGGITRVGRASFPTELGVALALRVMVHPTEADVPHEVQARLLAEDGTEVGRATIEFGIQARDIRPGEELAAAFPLNLHTYPIPSAGAYSFEVLIDGIHQASVPFVAEIGPGDADEES